MRKRTLSVFAVAMLSKAAFADVIVGKVAQVDSNDHKVAIRCESLPDVAPDESVYVTLEGNLQCELKVLAIHDQELVASSAECPHEALLTAGLIVEKTPYEGRNEAPAEQAKAAEPVAAAPLDLPVTYRAVLLVGFLPSSSTALEYRDQSGKLVASSESSGAGSPASVGAELVVLPQNSPLSVSFLGTVNRYRYKPKGADGHFTLMGVPRLERNLGALIPWVGLGMGITTVSLGDSSVTSDGVTVTTSESTAGYVFSPRAGLDMKFWNVIVGAQIAYVASSGSLDAVASDGKNSTTYVLHWRRTWSELSLRLGWEF